MEVASTPMRLETRGGATVAVTDEPLPTLSAEQVRQTRR